MTQHASARVLDIATRHGLELLDRIGAGGMGEVYVAKRVGASGFEKRVVVKHLPEHLSGDERFSEALIHEAKIMVRLNHGNIVQVFDLIAEGGHHLMVLEFVDGYSLRPIILFAQKKKTRVPLELVMAVAVQTAQALAFAHSFVDDAGHQAPVIHLDVTPDNVLVSRHATVKLTDFGIAATFQGTSVTTDGEVRGKLRYVAPEQLDHGKLTPATDVYSLALVIYELVTLKFGRPGDDTPVLIREALRGTHLELPPALAGGDELPAILRRASDPDPLARYPTAGELLADLRALAGRWNMDLSNNVVSQEFVRSLFSDPEFPLSGRRLPPASQLSMNPPPPNAPNAVRPADPRTQIEATAPARPSKTKAPVVLVVDDSDIVRAVLEEALPRFGLEVTAVEDANKAFDWLATHPCDAVLADLNMPGMGGLELCAFMRSNPQLAHVPVLLLTSETDSSRVVTGLGVGADDFIRKGVSEAEIAARVLAVLRRVGANRRP